MYKKLKKKIQPSCGNFLHVTNSFWNKADNQKTLTFFPIYWENVYLGENDVINEHTGKIHHYYLPRHLSIKWYFKLHHNPFYLCYFTTILNAAFTSMSRKCKGNKCSTASIWELQFERIHSWYNLCALLSDEKMLKS